VSRRRTTRAADVGVAASAVVGCADDAARLARPVMRLAEQETFVALCRSPPA